MIRALLKRWRKKQVEACELSALLDEIYGRPEYWQKRLKDSEASRLNLQMRLKALQNATRNGFQQLHEFLVRSADDARVRYNRECCDRFKKGIESGKRQAYEEIAEMLKKLAEAKDTEQQ